MFTLLMFAGFVAMTGLYGQGRFFLGSIALAMALGFGYLAEEMPHIEERIVGLIFFIGMVGMLVGAAAGVVSLFV